MPIGKQELYHIITAMRQSYFRPIVHDYLKSCSPLDAKRFSPNYKVFLRVLFIHGASHPLPVSLEDIMRIVGWKCSVCVYMMVGMEWLKVSHRRHTVITDKGMALVRACMKRVDEDYSTFFLAQEASKEEAIAKRSSKLALRKRKPRCKAWYSVKRVDISGRVGLF